MSPSELRDALNAIEIDPETLDAVAIALAVQELRRQAVTRHGRSAGCLLDRVADRLERAVDHRVRPATEEG